MGINGQRLRVLRRAALLHDIGKLGVSNLILDKPSRLSDAEMTQMRLHTTYTYEILKRVQGFSEFAEMASAHHERLDGRGYHRGIAGSELDLEVKILGVADIYEALAAKRPYRQDLSKEEVMKVLDKQAGTGLCPSVVSGSSKRSWRRAISCRTRWRRKRERVIGHGPHGTQCMRRRR